MAKKQMLYTPDGYQALVEELNYLKMILFQIYLEENQVDQELLQELKKIKY